MVLHALAALVAADTFVLMLPLLTSVTGGEEVMGVVIGVVGERLFALFFHADLAVAICTSLSRLGSKLRARVFHVAMDRLFACFLDQGGPSPGNPRV